MRGRHDDAIVLERDRHTGGLCSLLDLDRCVGIQCAVIGNRVNEFSCHHIRRVDKGCNIANISTSGSSAAPATFSP